MEETMHRREHMMQCNETQFAEMIGASKQRFGAGREMMTEDRNRAEDDQRGNSEEKRASTLLLTGTESPPSKLHRAHAWPSSSRSRWRMSLPNASSWSGSFSANTSTNDAAMTSAPNDNIPSTTRREA